MHFSIREGSWNSSHILRLVSESLLCFCSIAADKGQSFSNSSWTGTHWGFLALDGCVSVCVGGWSSGKLCVMLLFRTRIILHHLPSGSLPRTASQGLICSLSSAVLGWSISWMRGVRGSSIFCSTVWHHPFLSGKKTCNRKAGAAFALVCSETKGDEDPMEQPTCLCPLQVPGQARITLGLWQPSYSQ